MKINTKNQTTDAEKVLAAFEKGIGESLLKKAVLSKPRDKKIIKSVVELFSKNGEKMVKLETFFKDGKAVQKIFDGKDAPSLLTEISLEQYRQINLISESKSLQILVSDKGMLHFSGSLDGASKIKIADGQDKAKNYILTEENGGQFLSSLGLLGKNGKIHDKKQAKYRQINKFLEHIEAVLDFLPSGDEICICDLCCGKSYLTFAVYWYFTSVLGKKVEMFGVDLKKDVIEYCSCLAANLGFDGLSFECADVSQFVPKRQPDLVISLHACDVATDYVLAGAIKNNARVILSTPCCQHELNRQIKCPSLSAITEHSLLKGRLATVVTDALRAKMLETHGYGVTVCELIDPEETPKNLLLRAVKNPKPQSRKREIELVSEYKSLCHFLNLKPTLSVLLPFKGDFKDENILSEDGNVLKSIESLKQP